MIVCNECFVHELSNVFRSQFKLTSTGSRGSLLLHRGWDLFRVLEWFVVVVFSSPERFL